MSDHSDPEEGKAQCFGLGSIPYITNEVGHKAVDEYCGTAIVSGKKGDRKTAYFNRDTPDMVSLSIYYDDDVMISSDECKDFFNHLLSHCDGNEPLNYENLKHGGKYEHPKGATFEIAPYYGANPRCNGNKYKKWVDREVGNDKIMQFCKESSLRGEKGSRPSTVYNKGRNTELSITAYWTRDNPISFDDCVWQLQVALDNCDGNDPINNPLNNKYGGTFTNQGLVMVLTPNVEEPPTFPPDAIAPDGSEIIPQCGGGHENSEDDLMKGAEEFCKDGHEFYTYEYHSNPKPLDIILKYTASPIDQDDVYKQGSPVCRRTQDWQPGRIRAQDCKDAIRAMWDECKSQSRTITYWLINI